MKVLSASVTLIGLLAVAGTAFGQSSKPATLIIAGPGINSQGEALFHHVRTMFGVNSDDWGTTAVSFKGDKAHVYTGRIEDSPIIGARLDDQQRLQNAGRRVGELAARKTQAVLQLDMDLFGVDIAAAKGLAGEYERLSPTLAARRLSLKVAGQENPGREIRNWVRKQRTRWDQETERATKFIEQAAREFKRENGQDARVIVVGHSAFTDAINRVPVFEDPEKKKRLIDFRVMSSPMMRDLKDPERTIIFRHQYDLPAAKLGDIHHPDSQPSRGDWRQEGMVAELQSPVSDPFEAHSATQELTQPVDMRIRSPSLTQAVDFRGTPSDLIEMKLENALRGNPRSDKEIVEELKRQKPRESRVGGVTLTKPATVPLDASGIKALDYRNGRYVFRRGWREPVELPGQLHREISAAAIGSVYDVRVEGQPADEPSDRPPELTMMPFVDEHGKQWTAIGYIPRVVGQTRLGDLMLEADRILGDLAFGETEDYQAPAEIPNYHAYVELALDNEALRQDRHRLRVWMVPAAVETSLEGARLKVDACSIAVRFESYPTDMEHKYYQENADVAVRDPAGEFLGAQLTAYFDALAEKNPVSQDLKQAAALVGVLIWARQNNIELSSGAVRQVKKDYRRYEKTRVYGEPKRRSRTIEGKEWELVPAGKMRQLDSADLSRPAIVFNEHGISRLLWEDRTESRLKYDKAGRVSRLIGRRGDASRLLYDDEGRLVAIVDDFDEGVAFLRVSDPPVACYWADVRAWGLDCTLREDTSAVLVADVPGYLQQWIRDWTALEAERSEAAALREICQNSGTTFSWIRWTHDANHLQAAFVASVLLVAAIALRMSRFDDMERSVFEDLKRPANWSFLVPCAGAVLLLIIALETAPAASELCRRTPKENGRSWIALCCFLLPAALAAFLLFREGGRRDLLLRFAGGALALIGLCAARLCQWDGRELAVTVFVPSVIVVVCCLLFNLYQAVSRAWSGGLPNLSVFCLLLVVACAIYLWPGEAAIGGWSAAAAELPPAATVEHFSRTSLVSLAQLADSRSAAVTLTEPRHGLLVPAAALALLAVALDLRVSRQLQPSN